MVKGVKLKSQENLSKLIFVIFNAHPIKTVQCHCTLQVFYDVKECLAKLNTMMLIISVRASLGWSQKTQKSNKQRLGAKDKMTPFQPQENYD